MGLSCGAVMKAVALTAASLMLVCGCDNGGKDSSCVEGKGVSGEGVVSAVDAQSRLRILLMQVCL